VNGFGVFAFLGFGFGKKKPELSVEIDSIPLLLSA
jgi:hypothetical protein